MIAKLRGLLDAKSEDGVIVDVGGVGYLVFCGTRTVQELPGIGEAVELYVETHVREDHIHLFGFRSRTEQQWFRLLLTVQGVGAKVALALLSTLTPAALGQALAAQDKAAVGRTPGIGPKLAQRIVSELKDKAPTLGIAPQPVVAGATQGSVAVAEGAGDGRAEAEALSALANLGYGRSDAHAAIGRARATLGDAAGVEDLIREALRELAKG